MLPSCAQLCGLITGHYPLWRARPPVRLTISPSRRGPPGGPPPGAITDVMGAPLRASNPGGRLLNSAVSWTCSQPFPQWCRQRNLRRCEACAKRRRPPPRAEKSGRLPHQPNRRREVGTVTNRRWEVADPKEELSVQAGAHCWPPRVLHTAGSNR
jgi:hypothetical protein